MFRTGFRHGPAAHLLDEVELEQDGGQPGGEAPGDRCGEEKKRCTAAVAARGSVERAVRAPEALHERSRQYGRQGAALPSRP
ncbi:hypothetical protein SHKM778_26660 [Streptomyces sp. KM77-8]|uniref:Uncharacterized protein n=1 Tax=Streptomyces haneummycinicus TaxID=3074435 RepID=A0AAT9HFL0_9ACTN